MNLKVAVLAAILLIAVPIAVLAQADPSSSFTSSSSAICDGAGSAQVTVRADAYWTMTVYREYTQTSASGYYTTGPQNLTDIVWTGGTYALDGNNRWTEWDKMWIGTNASGQFVTQHYIEFDCTGKGAGEAAAVYICNGFTGNDPNICRAPNTTAAPPGPGIPEGFVLRAVTCDTPLYTTANGSPVPGGAAVTAGQTWYVAPAVDEENPGWIEGFFGGWTNAWLPAACVG